MIAQDARDLAHNFPVPTESRPAPPSLGWNTVGVRYSHFRVEIFRQLTALSKCASISIIKNYPPYSWMHSLQNGIQCKTIPTSNTENYYFKHSDYLSIYIVVLLAEHVFDCDITEVTCNGAVCECDHHLKFVFYCTNDKNIGIYVDETENNVHWLEFHSSFHVVFLTMVWQDYKVFEFACRISHSILIAQIGYTFYGPYPHGLAHNSFSMPKPLLTLTLNYGFHMIIKFI